MGCNNIQRTKKAKNKTVPSILIFSKCAAAMLDFEAWEQQNLLCDVTPEDVTDVLTTVEKEPTVSN